MTREQTARFAPPTHVKKGVAPTDHDTFWKQAFRGPIRVA